MVAGGACRQLEAEILRAEQRLGGLSAELDKASRGERSAILKSMRSEIEEIQTAIDGVTATLVAGSLRYGKCAAARSRPRRRLQSWRRPRGPMRFGFGVVPIIRDPWW